MDLLGFHVLNDFLQVQDACIDLQRAPPETAYGVTPTAWDLPPRAPSTDFPLPLHARRWGPLHRGGDVRFREMHPALVWGPAPTDVQSMLATAAQTAASTAPEGPRGRLRDRSSADGQEDAEEGSEWAWRALSNGPYAVPDLPGVRFVAKTKVTVPPDAGGTGAGQGKTVHWLDGALWLTGLDASDAHAPSVWLQRIGALFDAQRANATASFGGNPADGYLHAIQGWEVAAVPSIFMEPPTHVRSTVRVAGQWDDMPPQDVLLFAGPGAAQVATDSGPAGAPTALSEWAASTSCAWPPKRIPALSSVRNCSPRSGCTDPVATLWCALVVQSYPVPSRSSLQAAQTPTCTASTPT